MDRSKLRIHVFAMILILALVFTSVVSAAPKDGPVVKLSVAQSEFDSGQNVPVTVIISNSTKHTVRVLKWFTPVDDVEEPLFAVFKDGQRVGYTGSAFKRPDATGKDYISLKAGESITAVVDLSKFYDLSEAGSFDVYYDVSAINLFNEKGNFFMNRDSLKSESIRFKGNGGLGKGKPTPPPPGSNAFDPCSTDQQDLIIAARDQAKIYASNSDSYLASNKTGPRYTTWFGLYDSLRYDTVMDHFTAISNAMDNAGVTFNCKCKQPIMPTYTRINRMLFICARYSARHRFQGQIPRLELSFMK